MERRTFIRVLSGSAIATVLPLNKIYSNPISLKDKWGDLLPLRAFGKTQIQVTMLGLGGFHIGRMEDKLAQQTIEAAISGGIRFIDTAESYQDGVSEEKLGRLLVPKYRNEVFVMTKTRAEDRKTAQSQLEGSLKRLQCDYLDLWQMHDIKNVADAKKRIEQGVLDVMLEAKQKGKIKHLGFTGHTNPEGLNYLAQYSDELEACMLPVNVLDPSYNSFIKNSLPVLLEKNIGIIAMKTMAGGSFFGGGFDGWKKEKNIVMNDVSMKEAMHFVWSLPVGVLVTGPKTVEMLQEKIDLVKSYVKMTEPEQETLIKKVAHWAGTEIEYYKE